MLLNRVNGTWIAKKLQILRFRKNLVVVVEEGFDNGKLFFDSEVDLKVFSMLDSSLRSDFNCYGCERTLFNSEDFYFLNLVSSNLCRFFAARVIQICSHLKNYVHIHSGLIFMKKDLNIVSENL